VMKCPLSANRRHSPFSINRRTLTHHDAGGGAVHSITSGHLVGIDIQDANEVLRHE